MEMFSYINKKNEIKYVKEGIRKEINVGPQKIRNRERERT